MSFRLYLRNDGMLKKILKLNSGEKYPLLPSMWDIFKTQVYADSTEQDIYSFLLIDTYF